MKLAPVAVSAAILLLTLATSTNSQTTPSPGQPTESATRTNFASNTPVQAPSQVSTAQAQPSVRPLTGEEMGDLYMARKQYYEAAETYKRLTEQEPRNAIYLNKLGIALHQQEAL